MTLTLAPEGEGGRERRAQPHLEQVLGELVLVAEEFDEHSAQVVLCRHINS